MTSIGFGSATAIKIGILEDNPNMIGGLQAELTRPHFEICVISDDLDEFIDLIAVHTPDIAIVDLRIWRDPDAGWEAIERVKVVSPTTKSIIYTHHDSLSNFDRALRADVRGFFSKDHAVKPEFSLADIVRIVASGGRYYDNEVHERYWQAARTLDAVEIEEQDSVKNSQEIDLSPRVIEVLSMYDQGLSDVEIASKLIISVFTVRAHTQNAREKLRVHSTRDAIRVAKLMKLM